MRNDATLKQTIDRYFANTATEQTVKAYMLKALADFPLENIKCLQIEDNTLNGIDTEKNSWRAHFVDVKTEEDFFIEVSVTSSGMYKSRCYTFDDNDNICEIHQRLLSGRHSMKYDNIRRNLVDAINEVTKEIYSLGELSQEQIFNQNVIPEDPALLFLNNSYYRLNEILLCLNNL